MATFPAVVHDSVGVDTIGSIRAHSCHSWFEKRCSPRLIEPDRKEYFMTDISSPEVYFTQVVPQQYAAALAAAPANVADQPELTAVYTITGAGGAVYTLRGADSKIDALIGDQIASPDMRIVMSYDDW